MSGNRNGVPDALTFEFLTSKRALNDILVIVWTCVWGEVVCNVADMCLSLLFQICAAVALLLPSSAPVAPKLEGSIF